ncbi:MAG: polysaccharide biosynthesis C-terminal domain-containing protein [bacterium]|nr:polysaccharide biosynthesis C-terminal domain-containing protein [bacterium]
MGVIQRQGIINSLVNYFGIALGFFATLFIYPLDWDLYGSIQYWISSAMLLTPILRLGTNGLIQKFYPYFEKNNIPGFLGMIFQLAALSVVSMSLLILIVAYFLQDTNFLERLQMNQHDALIVYLFCLALIATNIFQAQAANARRIVVPDLISNVFFKLFLMTLILGSYYGFLDKALSGPLLILFYVGTALLLLFYIISLGKFSVKGFSWKSLPKHFKQEVISYWLLGVLNTLGLVLAYKIDVFIIGSSLDNKSVGYYSMFLFMTNVMMVPMNSLSQISAPEISESFEHDDIPRIDRIYKKTSNNLLVIGTVILVTIWIGILFLLDIMNNGSELKPFIYCLFFLGIAKILDLSTSVNHLIINYSKWYRYNMLFLVLVSALNITLNLILIDQYGIVGVAMATMTSLFIYNSIKTWFIYHKLKIHPFNSKTLVIFGILAIGLFIGSMLQSTALFQRDLLNLLLYCGLTASLLSLLFYFLKISPELNAIADKFVKRKQ